jgi:hypothetical protein
LHRKPRSSSSIVGRTPPPKIGGLGEGREVYEPIYGNSTLAEQILDFYARKVYTDLRSGD